MNRKYLQPKRIFELMLYADKYSGEIFRTNTFKKDFKSVVKGHQINLTEFFVMLLWIQKGLPMPKSFKKHKLEGTKESTIDVHVEPNLVLWYRITDGHIRLLRLRNHSDLSKK